MDEKAKETEGWFPRGSKSSVSLGWKSGLILSIAVIVFTQDLSIYYTQQRVLKSSTGV